jgi:hypothetical protein
MTTITKLKKIPPLSAAAAAKCLKSAVEFQGDSAAAIDKGLVFH